MSRRRRGPRGPRPLRVHRRRKRVLPDRAHGLNARGHVVYVGHLGRRQAQKLGQELADRTDLVGEDKVSAMRPEARLPVGLALDLGDRAVWDAVPTRVLAAGHDLLNRELGPAALRAQAEYTRVTG